MPKWLFALLYCELVFILTLAVLGLRGWLQWTAGILLFSSIGLAVAKEWWEATHWFVDDDEVE